MSHQATAETSGTALAQAWFANSPFVLELGMRLIDVGSGEARVDLPYRPALATAGDLVHGGVIGALADTAAALAAWSEHDPSNGTRWGTIAMSLNLLAAARGTALVAHARTTKRGKLVCFCHVDVTDEHQRPIADALVSYRLG